MAPRRDPRMDPEPDGLKHRLSELKAASARRHRIAPDTPEHTAALEVEEALQATIWRVQSAGDPGREAE